MLQPVTFCYWPTSWCGRTVSWLDYEEHYQLFIINKAYKRSSSGILPQAFVFSIIVRLLTCRHSFGRLHSPDPVITTAMCWHVLETCSILLISWMLKCIFGLGFGLFIVLYVLALCACPLALCCSRYDLLTSLISWRCVCDGISQRDDEAFCWTG